MPKSRAEKEALLQEVRDRLRRAQGAVLLDYRGLTVAEMDELRRRLRERGVELRVVKNTLAWLAAREMGLEGLRPHLDGPTAIAFGYDDPVAVAKGVLDYAEETKKVQLKGGVLEGRVIGLAEVKALARLPGRAELLARVLGGLRAPLAGLAGCLQAPLRGFAGAVEALRAKQAGA